MKTALSLGMLGIVQDITETDAREDRSSESTPDALQLINNSRAASFLPSSTSRSWRRRSPTRRPDSVGAQFGAFFYNVLDEGGGSYMQYAVSGVDRHHFERFPLPRATSIIC